MPAPETPFYHCWRARLGPVPAGALATLSAPERARLARYHSAASQQAYGGAHLLLREVLAAYAGHPPAALVFGTDARHKPTLHASKPLWFNLSYRTRWALLAVSNQGEVGVDVEESRPVAGADALVEQLFSPAEQQALHQASGPDWWALFCGIWTRKEAWAKRLGMGLALPFAGFSVAGWAGAAVAWQVPGAGRLDGFAIDDDHLAALATGPEVTAEPVAWQYFEYPFPQSLAAFEFPR